MTIFETIAVDMSLKVKTFLSFLLALVLIALLIHSNSNIQPDFISQKKIDRFRNIIQEKQKELALSLDQIWGIIENEGPDALRTRKAFEKTKKEGTFINLFRNDTLVYWSGNEMYLPEIITSDFKDSEVHYLGNAWYLSEIKTEGAYTLNILFRIKYDYEYENNFLSSEFNNEFNLPSSLFISEVPYAEGYPVFNSKNEYIFSLVPEKFDEHSYEFQDRLLFFLALASFLLFMWYCTDLAYKLSKTNLWLIALILDFFLVRFLMMYHHFPAVFYSMDLCNPLKYAHSMAIPNLGDLMLDVIFGFVFILIAYRKLFVEDRQRTTVHFVTGGIITGGMLILSDFLIDSIINNSSLVLEPYRIFELNQYSIIGIATILVLLFVNYLLINLFLKSEKPDSGYKNAAIIGFTGTIVIFGFAVSGIWAFNFSSLIFYFVLLISVFLVRKIPGLSKYFILVVLSLIVSFYATFNLTQKLSQKEESERKVLALNLANERDAVAEFLFQNMYPDLKEDKTVQNLMFGGFENQDEILKYLLRKYFAGFWSKYDLDVFLCNTSVNFPRDNQLDYCNRFFDEIITSTGIEIKENSFYFLDNNNGRISYLVVINRQDEDSLSDAKVFIELNSKLVSEELGYPELLLDKKVSGGDKLSEYSYAKFHNGSLITKSGDFRYDRILNENAFPVEEFAFADFNDFTHLRYKIDDSNSIVISKKSVGILDFLVSFAYLFISIVLVLSVISITSRILRKDKINFGSFRSRIAFSVISILLVSLVLIGFVTIYFNIGQYEEKQNRYASEKIQSVLTELSHKMENEIELRDEESEYITDLLIKWSHVFISDINIYTPDGFLYASSRPEIYSRNLIGQRMNSEALNQLSGLKKDQYIHNEAIGKMNYLSIYVPFSNSEGKILAYLNLPYFTKQKNLTKENSVLLAAIINIYLLLTLFAIITTLLVTSRLSKPLRLIQKSMSQLRLEQNNEPIEYSGTDELGSLIKEYNRMLIELEESADLLARSERESAWREMAKQIAHEIKNPLTPMRLNIQHLQKSWNDKAPDLDDKIRKITNTIIEQIDTLSAIANSFSSFAKMPGTNRQEINIDEKIGTAIALFTDTDNVEIFFESNEESPIILADSEQITRVFNNLIKNAIQAIPKERKGEIKISSTVVNKKVLISITDNGSGIDQETQEKLFLPSFTTKTSGMGLGLAIVKNIVENSEGKIWFETNPGYGSTFYIEFPIIDSE